MSSLAQPDVLPGVLTQWIMDTGPHERHAVFMPDVVDSECALRGELRRGVWVDAGAAGAVAAFARAGWEPAWSCSGLRRDHTAGSLRAWIDTKRRAAEDLRARRAAGDPEVQNLVGTENPRVATLLGVLGGLSARVGAATHPVRWPLQMARHALYRMRHHKGDGTGAYVALRGLPPGGWPAFYRFQEAAAVQGWYAEVFGMLGPAFRLATWPSDTAITAGWARLTALVASHDWAAAGPGAVIGDA